MKELINQLIVKLQELNKQTGGKSLSVYIDGRSYNYINLETGIIDFGYSIPASCGCCSDFDNDAIHISELSPITQLEIINELIK